jgi:hypothetical protein
MAFLDCLLWSSDLWQDRQISKLRAAVNNLQIISGGGSAEQVENLARLKWENAELRLYLASLLRILMEKKMVTPEELHTAVAALAGAGTLPLEPPKETDWTAAPPPVRDPPEGASDYEARINTSRPRIAAILEYRRLQRL